ncbi:MAG: hypothetical protein ABI947_12370 [Chloroflexota bacterium]
MAHRNIPSGENFTIVEFRLNFMLVMANTPYPADTTYGYLWAIAKCFRPLNTTFSVTRVENLVADEYPGNAYEIRWG